MSRVGVVLPLTQRTQVPEQYGTRHRAAMGLAERCDAAVVVVSEERGEVTLMCGDDIRVAATESELVAWLTALTAAQNGDAQPSRRRFALNATNVKLAAAALALSALVWSLTFVLPGSSVRVQSVPLEFTNVPPGLSVTSQSADAVEVWIRGSDFVFGSAESRSAGRAVQPRGRPRGRQHDSRRRRHVEHAPGSPRGRVHAKPGDRAALGRRPSREVNASCASQAVARGTSSLVRGSVTRNVDP